MTTNTDEWDDDLLDRALAATWAAATADTPSIRPVEQRIRAGLRRQRLRPIRIAVAAVAVAAAVVLGVLAPSVLTSHGAVQNTAAAASLREAAAAAIRVADTPVPPGSYRHIRTVSENLTGGYSDGNVAVITRTRYAMDLWIPADPAGTWTRRDTSFGDVAVISGAANAAAAGVVLNRAPTVGPDLTAACGAFYGPGECVGPGNWQTPTLEWIRNLPTDPAAMYDRLSADSSGHGRSDEDSMLTYATDLLSTGLLPSPQRAALYGALARVPGIDLAASSTDFDGRIGTGFAITTRGIRHEMIIDPRTGLYMGTRETQLETDPDAPAGTIIELSAVNTDIDTRIPAHP